MDPVPVRKMSLLLDLDSTVINSLDTKEIQLAPKDFQSKFKWVNMKGYYRIFQRPHLQTFLDYAFANFDVTIFTAADKDYALFIIKNIILIKPERKLRYVFYGYTSALSENYYNSPKDLRLLWDVLQVEGIKPCGTVLIDDLSDVYEANPNNVIRAPKFELLKKNKPDWSQVHDSFMLSVIPQLEARKSKFQQSFCGCLQGKNCDKISY